MKALELAKTVEHWVSCDAGIRGQECRAAAAELRRLAEVNAELLAALEGALEHWPVPSSICKDRPAYEAAYAALDKAKEHQ